MIHLLLLQKWIIVENRKRLQKSTIEQLSEATNYFTGKDGQVCFAESYLTVFRDFFRFSGEDDETDGWTCETIQNRNLQSYEFLLFALASRAAPIIRQIFELRSHRDIMLRIALGRIVGIPAGTLVTPIAETHCIEFIIFCHIEYLQFLSGLMPY